MLILKSATNLQHGINQKMACCFPSLPFLSYLLTTAFLLFLLFQLKDQES